MKTRIVTIALFSFGILSLARADELYVKGRDKMIVGNVKTEDSKGLVINMAVDKKRVDVPFPAADLIDIFYEEVRPVSLITKGGAYREAHQADKESGESNDPAKRKAAISNALARYAETLGKMETHKTAKRNIEYRIAILTLRQATNEQLAPDKAMLKLQAFKIGHPNSWQIVQAMPLIAQTQMDAGKFAEAADTFAEMAAMDALPAETRVSAELEVVRVLVRAKKIDEAQKKLIALTAKAAGDKFFASRVKMTEAELLIGQNKMDKAEPLLQQVVKESNDRQIKAIAHNTLGECYFKTNRHSEALWEFLWVDAVFNQDKNQHAMALYYLWKTFEQLNNAERAQECREMLLNDKQFTGTEYQIRGAREVK